MRLAALLLVLPLAVPAVADHSRTRAESNPHALRSGHLETPYLPRRGYADGPYGQVHYRDTGSGRPLVLIHQAPQSSRQFTNVYGPLHERGIRAIGVDLPGFGESDPTGFVPTIEDWAAVVPAVLDHLGVEKADIAGHHTGAMVATEVALQFPERVHRVVLNGPFPMDAERRQGLLQGMGKREVEFEYAADGSHLKDTYDIRYELYGDGADPKTITRYTIDKFSGYAPFWTGHHAAFIYDHAASISRLKHPTLVLTNTGDQIYEEAQMTRGQRPDFAYVELNGGGIDVVDQLTTEWVDSVSNFLRVVE
ncbi:MAG: alpha/beta hydrolase [Woeseiaceae bacterium]|nr:alpha/beta hydrolase [Woeseiaceae bacterium]